MCEQKCFVNVVSEVFSWWWRASSNWQKKLNDFSIDKNLECFEAGSLVPVFGTFEFRG